MKKNKKLEKACEKEETVFKSNTTRRAKWRNAMLAFGMGALAVIVTTAGALHMEDYNKTKADVAETQHNVRHLEDQQDQQTDQSEQDIEQLEAELRMKFSEKLIAKLSEFLGVDVDKNQISFDLENKAFFVSGRSSVIEGYDTAYQTKTTLKDGAFEIQTLALTQQDGQIVDSSDQFDQAWNETVFKKQLMNVNGIWTTKDGDNDVYFFSFDGKLCCCYVDAEGEFHPSPYGPLATEEQLNEFEQNLQLVDSGNQAKMQELYNKIIQNSENAQNFEQE